MIGRNEEVPEGGGARFRGLDVQTAESNNNAVNIIGTTRSASLKEVIERANDTIGLTLRLRYDNNISQLMRRSDHWPFLNTGVPAVWVHTGLHPDYHTPTTMRTGSTIQRWKRSRAWSTWGRGIWRQPRRGRR